MSTSNILDDILGLLGTNEPIFNVLEQTVDVDFQNQYFEYAFKNKHLKSKDIDADIDKLSLNETSFDEKKDLLVGLATCDDVKSYRALENYSKTAEGELRDWAIMAVNESRMILESSLTNQRRVFISTGLGGSGNKLRYFCVFLSNDEISLSDFQQDILKKELEYALPKQKAVLEEINFYGSFISLVALIPLSVSVQNILQKVIEECNYFGNFLSNDMIISNIKRMNPEEIRYLIDNKLHQFENESETQRFDANFSDDDSQN